MGRSKLDRCGILPLIAIVVLPVQSSLASAVGYSFSGLVSFSSPAHLYGITVPANSPFSGQFFFDPSTQPITVQGAADISIYPQEIPGGFLATVGNMTVDCDSYAIEISNDLAQKSGPPKDIVTIIYWSGLNPAPQQPLVVNGVGHTVGRFEIDLTGGSSLYSSSALPAQLRLSDFMSALSILNDEVPVGAVDLLSTVTSLTPFVYHRGDVNRDGHVNAADISSLMLALSDLHNYQSARKLSDDDLLALCDVDQSRTITNADLQSLLSDLAEGGGSMQAVPEPSSISLLFLAVVFCSSYFSRTILNRL